MPIITPTNKSVTTFTGLHLYHAPFSNCAMRVRIALAEKKLQWTSHLIDLSKGEQRTKEYLGINPNGVVPTLVDEGVVIIDSTDIIDYLDATYEPNSLRPDTEAEQQAMYDWMHMARDNHLSIKTYMYYQLGVTGLSEAVLAEYRKNQTYDKALLEFHEHRSQHGFSQTDIDTATAVLNDCFAKMDARLKDHDWLAGDDFSLADITWIPQLVVLNKAGYPFAQYRHFECWKNAVMARPSFKQAVTDWLKLGQPENHNN